MQRWLVTVGVVLALVAGASCGAKGADSADGGRTSSREATTTTATGSNGDTFGTLAESPCGPGDATVAAADAGRGTDKLYIGVANDRSSNIRPGLVKELYDGTVGFAKWCNAQGGVRGLQLEPVDLDGKILEVEAAMATACTDVFALVGGGWTQDDLVYTGKDGSDYKRCGMIAYPGMAVSPKFGDEPDSVQALAGSNAKQQTSYLKGLAKVYPDAVKHFGLVQVEIPSVRQKADQYLAVAQRLDAFGDPKRITYDPISQDWALVAQQVISQDMTAVFFLGEPDGLSKFHQALKDQDWDGVVLSETNQYDSRLLASSGPEAVEGVVLRIGIHPFEEADRWPATKQFLEIMDTEVPGWQRAALAAQAFSTALFFATIAGQCADEGEITRACVLATGKQAREWDGGGLHTMSDPGAATPTECSMLVTVRDGAFTRLFPEIGSADDDGEGYHCSELVDVGEVGDGG